MEHCPDLKFMLDWYLGHQLNASHLLASLLKDRHWLFNGKSKLWISVRVLGQKDPALPPPSMGVCTVGYILRPPSLKALTAAGSGAEHSAAAFPSLPLVGGNSHPLESHLWGEPTSKKWPHSAPCSLWEGDGKTRMMSAWKHPFLRCGMDWEVAADVGK